MTGSTYTPQDKKQGPPDLRQILGDRMELQIEESSEGRHSHSPWEGELNHLLSFGSIQEEADGRAAEACRTRKTPAWIWD